MNAGKGFDLLENSRDSLIQYPSCVVREPFLHFGGKPCRHISSSKHSTDFTLFPSTLNVNSIMSCNLMFLLHTMLSEIE